MYVKFDPCRQLPDGIKVKNLVGFLNGSFSLFVERDDRTLCLILYDGNGTETCQIVGIEEDDAHVCGIIFDDSGYLVGKYYPETGKIDGVISDENGPIAFFNSVEVFPNSAFVAAVNQDDRMLADPEHSILLTANFEEAKIFNMGFALRVHQCWYLFTVGGHFIRKVSNCQTFLGDGCLLLNNRKTRKMSLVSFAGNKLSQKAIVGFEQFPNGRFVLESADGLKCMYDVDGSALSVEVKNAVFMPDGNFVQCDDSGHVTAFYRPNGSLKHHMVYRFELAGNYYLLDSDKGNGLLYDDKGHLLGDNYKVIKAHENFLVVLSGENDIEVYNQFGLVLVVK